MRRSPISSAVAEEEDINLTPMLDVVFILLIFFIVTANFIKEPGLEVIDQMQRLLIFKKMLQYLLRLGRLTISGLMEEGLMLGR